MGLEERDNDIDQLECTWMGYPALRRKTADRQNLGADHPFLAFLVVVGGAVTFVFLLQRCMKRDAREGRESTRLD